MATPLTPHVARFMNLIAQAYKVQVTIPSVAASSTSPRYSIPIQAVEGVVLQVRIAYPAVTTVDFFIYSSDLGTRGSLEEIIRAEGITQCLQPPPQQIYFENTDPDKDAFLYVEVDNTGATLPTGELELELIIRVEGMG